MSVEAFGRALYAPLGGNPKVILLGIANHAHADGTNAYPSIDTLAGYAHCDRRTAQRNVRKLESDGYIEREGVGPAGQTRWRIVFAKWDGGDKMPPVAPDDVGGDKSAPEGAAPVPPEPSIEPSTKPSSGGGRARASARGNDVPDDFPDELRPHARAVYRVLRSVAEHHNAKAVSAKSLAHVLMARPHHPLVRAAHDFAAWAMESGRSRRRDVVAGYRNWLDKCEELAGVERLPGDGPAQMPSNVHPLRRGQRMSNAETVEAQIQALRSASSAAGTDTFGST